MQGVRLQTAACLLATPRVIASQNRMHLTQSPRRVSMLILNTLGWSSMATPHYTH
jgi:hypothetical protein